MKNFKISGVTEHAIKQALFKGAPIIKPRRLRRMEKQAEVKRGYGKGGRYAFISRDDEFVYITNRRVTAVITVLTWTEYQNLMHS